MIELVNTVTGERIDLRFVEGLQIKLADLPPEIAAELAELERFRRRWHELMTNVLGVPAHLLRDERGEF